MIKTNARALLDAWLSSLETWYSFTKLGGLFLANCAMTTPHSGSGYISRNVDGGNLNAPIASEEKNVSADHDFSKADIKLDVRNGELHREPSEDSFVDKNVPVESAADLVAQIIHLEDDPDEASLTFRTWFLGKRDVPKYLYDLLSCVL